MGKARKTKKIKKEEEEVYHVEVIERARVVLSKSDDDNQPSEWEYFVKWAGYESDANTWEPTKNLEGCQRLLDSFWTHIGLDDKDYTVGYEVTASKIWIKKEKEFFAKNYNAAQAEKMRQVDEEKEKTTISKVSNPKKRKASASRERSIPLKEGSSSKRQKTPKESSHASEDDLPLGQMPKKGTLPITIKVPPTNAKKRKVLVSSSSSEDEPLQQAQQPRSRIKKKKKRAMSDAKDIIEIDSSPEPSPTSLFSRESSPELALMDQGPSKNKLKTVVASSKATNSRDEIANMPLPRVSSTSGISTKQRLSIGALAPTPAKGFQEPKAQPKPPPNRTGSALMGLSFKKRKFSSEISPATITGKDPTPTFAFRSPVQEHELPPALVISTSHQSPILTQSPLAMTPSTSFSAPVQKTLAFRRPPILTSTSVPSPATRTSMTEAEAFLQDIMPTELSTPLETHTEIDGSADVVPPKALHVTKAALPTRNKKPEWKWSGSLFVGSAETPVCKVKIHNVLHDEGLSFSIAFQTVERIEVPYMYDLADLRSVLQVFQKPTQLGLLSPEGDADNSHYNTLIQYSEKSQKVFLVPIILDDNITGHTLFFPRIFHASLGIEIPLELIDSSSQGPQFIAAILPYALSQEQLKSRLQSSIRRCGTLIQSTSNIDYSMLSTKQGYHQALQMLNFPKDLYDYIGHQTYKHPYSIWSGRDAKTISRTILDTRLLQNIIDQAQGFEAGDRSEARVIFIHVGALSTVHKLAEFVERRANSPHVRFYTYGTATIEPPGLWAVKEIWPCGGIITFTPSAMLKDPMGVRNLIMQVSKHPLWLCYVLPASLGSLAKLECGKEDPLTMLEKGHLVMQMVLEAIEDGDLALLQAPPPKSHSNTEEESQWLSDFVSFTSPTQSEALKKGITAFLKSASSGRSIEAQISKDLALMERQPAFITEYRRYVVIQSQSEIDEGNIHSDGFEWTTTTKFDFKDEYFPKQLPFD